MAMIVQRVRAPWSWVHETAPRKFASATQCLLALMSGRWIDLNDAPLAENKVLPAPKLPLRLDEIAPLYSPEEIAPLVSPGFAGDIQFVSEESLEDMLYNDGVRQRRRLAGLSSDDEEQQT